MQRYMVRLLNRGYGPEDARMILRRVLSMVSAMGDAVDIRDVRVASRHIELDVSLEPSMLDRLMAVLRDVAEPVGYTEVRERAMSKEERIIHARELFNAERYWEAHEMLEGAWRDSTGDEKELLQGIILVCAALVHAQKAEHDVCISILRRALSKLQGKPEHYHGLDVAGMVRQVGRALGGDIGAILEYRL
ncbi:MAG: DUF309 domain-containing protein [Candidatus Nitrosocaldus sp.]|nr:DUF309 domain-containing protein [Candidatus Nitrosocaldus sp.]MDW8000403.1 DUF309 domain-containing protein [Candidatus Nitrosocaldus sp.]